MVLVEVRVMNFLSEMWLVRIFWVINMGSMVLSLVMLGWRLWMLREEFILVLWV